MEEEYIELLPVNCPICGGTTFMLAKEGVHPFKCECGYEDQVKITAQEE